jgi:hypothetical protein
VSHRTIPALDPVRDRKEPLAERAANLSSPFGRRSPGALAGELHVYCAGELTDARRGPDGRRRRRSDHRPPEPRPGYQPRPDAMGDERIPPPTQYRRTLPGSRLPQGAFNQILALPAWKVYSPRHKEEWSRIPPPGGPGRTLVLLCDRPATPDGLTQQHGTQGPEQGQEVV